MEWAHSLEITGSVRVANNDRDSALEVAAEYVENGVRRATDDCVLLLSLLAIRTLPTISRL